MKLRVATIDIFEDYNKLINITYLLVPRETMSVVALEPVVKRGEAEFNNRLEGPQNSLFSEGLKTIC